MSTSDQFVMTGNLPPPLGHKIKNKNKLADSLRGKQPGLKLWWDNVSKVALLVTVVTANCSRSRWKDEKKNATKEIINWTSKTNVKVLSPMQSVLSAMQCSTQAVSCVESITCYCSGEKTDYKSCVKVWPCVCVHCVDVKCSISSCIFYFFNLFKNTKARNLAVKYI